MGQIGNWNYRKRAIYSEISTYFTIFWRNYLTTFFMHNSQQKLYIVNCPSKNTYSKRWLPVNDSSVARTFPGGLKRKTIWGKMREKTGKWRKIEKIFWSCPPGDDRLAMALVNETYTCNCSFFDLIWWKFFIYINSLGSILKWSRNDYAASFQKSNWN